MVVRGYYSNSSKDDGKYERYDTYTEALADKSHSMTVAEAIPKYFLSTELIMALVLGGRE